MQQRVGRPPRADVRLPSRIAEPPATTLAPGGRSGDDGGTANGKDSIT
jgi:hypothetical protein